MGGKSSPARQSSTAAPEAERVVKAVMLLGVGRSV